MMLVDNDLINKILEKNTKEIATFFNIEQGVVKKYKKKLYNIKKESDDEKNKYKSTDLSVSLIYQRNLRNTLCDKMTELFEEYRKEDEIKMAEIIGIGHGELSNLIHNGHVLLNDFLIICDYLKPSDLLKEDWKHSYVSW